MTSSGCPSHLELCAFLEGADDHSAIAEHVNSCTLCQNRLDDLMKSELVDDIPAAKLREIDPGETTRIAKVMDNIRAAGEVAESEELTFAPGLIGPSDYPGALGRLGAYELLELVGRGGMGAVFRAYDPVLQRIVAIKLLAPHLAHNPQARRRFIREAQAAAAVCHDHVVTTHAIHESAEQPAIVMQYVSGRSLQQKIDADGPLEFREILRISLQTASGLAAAHTQGLVHRDVKPANILLENGVQKVRLTDFGLARAADDSGMTASGVIAGTPEYMAPEQAKGETITFQADLFSLGSVMYAMCTGRSPFRASTTMGVLRNVCETVPRPVRDVNPDIPEWFCEIIDRLLAKIPAERFGSAKEVAEQLEKWLAHVQHPLAVPPPMPNPDPRDGRTNSELSDAGSGNLSALPDDAAVAKQREKARSHSGDSEYQDGAPSSDETDDRSALIRRGRTSEERALIQRALNIVELPSLALIGTGSFCLIALWAGMNWQDFRLPGGNGSVGHLSLKASPLEVFQAGGPLLQSAAFIVMILAGTQMARLRTRWLGVTGAVLANMTSQLEVPGVLGAAVGIWTLFALLRHDVINACHLVAELQEEERIRRLPSSTNAAADLDAGSPSPECAVVLPEQRPSDVPASSAARTSALNIRWWQRRSFWTVPICVAAALWLVRTWDLRLPGSSMFRGRSPVQIAGEESIPEPPRFTLRKADETLPIGRTDARRMTLSAGGAFVAVAGGTQGDGFVKIWNAQTLQEVGIQTTPHVIHSLAYGDHGRVLATGESDGNVRIRDGKSGAVQWEIPAHGGPVTSVAFDRWSEALVTAGDDDRVWLWKDRRSLKTELPGVRSAVSDVGVSEDGQVIAAACQDGHIHLWDREGKPVRQIRCPSVPLRISLGESEGQLAMALNTGQCQVLLLRDLHLVAQWTLSGTRPTDLQSGFWTLPRAAVFITSDDVGTVRLHNFVTFREHVTLKSSSPVIGAHLISTKEQIVSAHADGLLRIWNLNRP